MCSSYKQLVTMMQLCLDFKSIDIISAYNATIGRVSHLNLYVMRSYNVEIIIYSISLSLFSKKGRVTAGTLPSAMNISQFRTWVRRCLAFSSCRLVEPVMCFIHMLRTLSVNHGQAQQSGIYILVTMLLKLKLCTKWKIKEVTSHGFNTQ